ncbi:uncharacterized protein C8Q71DRAFT_727574 [Rhodofomes roseus]|uniref:Uncharacterized protein n=1 Tax=Rhodofomes roseus TaxID=34475 RepID=A0ABQ8K215_9APHY|nr:uncharacterized protein C8Q71DRAFT_727574 [Rhodofomes roseus]KAH9830339.1 hypothetical protein C8Q71DRAFT_727574 [Rhodofomes roseus]
MPLPDNPLNESLLCKSVPVRRRAITQHAVIDVANVWAASTEGSRKPPSPNKSVDAEVKGVYSGLGIASSRGEQVAGHRPGDIGYALFGPVQTQTTRRMVLAALVYTLKVKSNPVSLGVRKVLSVVTLSFTTSSKDPVEREEGGCGCTGCNDPNSENGSSLRERVAYSQDPQKLENSSVVKVDSFTSRRGEPEANAWDEDYIRRCCVGVDCLEAAAGGVEDGTDGYEGGARGGANTGGSAPSSRELVNGGDKRGTTTHDHADVGASGKLAVSPPSVTLRRARAHGAGGNNGGGGFDDGASCIACCVIDGVWEHAGSLSARRTAETGVGVCEELEVVG